MRYTPFAGLVRLERGESISTNDYEFYTNTDYYDAMASHFANHRHDGSPAMSGFASDPIVTPSAVGGYLPGGDTWYIGITAIDAYGGETDAQVASALSLGGIDDPTIAPSATIFDDGTGSDKTAGTYRYAYTRVDSSGETLPSPITNATINTNGRILITPPATASASWRLYRQYGFGPMQRLGSTHSASAVMDDGGEILWCDQYPPEENTTGAEGSITVERPALPSGAVGWRVYGSRLESLRSPSLYASGTMVASADTIVITSLSEFITGYPPRFSRTFPGAAQIFASEVIYAGAPDLASGTVEGALDDLSEQVAEPRVDSIRASGQAPLTGDVVLVAGSGVSLGQTGQNITINSTASGGGVDDISFDGATPLTGSIGIFAGSGISIASAGSAVTIHSDDGVSGISFNGGEFIDGDVGFIAGIGISMASGASGVTISASGAGPHTHPPSDIEDGGAASGDILRWDGSEWIPVELPDGIPGGPEVVLEEVHTWSIGTDVSPSGFYPPMRISMASGQESKLVAVHYMQSAPGASATFDIEINGTGATGFTGLVAEDSWQETDPADVDLADDDVIGLVITDVDGAASGMSVSIVLQHTMPGAGMYLDDLIDVDAPSPASGHSLRYFGGEWVASGMVLGDLSDVDVVTNGLDDGYVILYNEFLGKWMTGWVNFSNINDFGPAQGGRDIGVPAEAGDILVFQDPFWEARPASAWVPPTVFYENHTWAVGSDVVVASGDMDGVMPPMRVRLRNNQTAKIVSVDHKQTAPAASATFDVEVTGVAGYSGLTADDSWQQDANEVDLVDGDDIQPVVTAIIGTPRNLSITITVEHTVAAE